MTTNDVVSTRTPSTTTPAAALNPMLAYTPKDPDAPASDGQIALMRRFELKVKRNLTKGQANVALRRFFEKNPEVAAAYQEERKQRRQEQWAAKVREYEVLAKARSQETNRVPATARQISAVMAAAFVRTDVTEGQRIEARTVLQYGVGSAMASTFLDQLPQRAPIDPAQAN